MANNLPDANPEELAGADSFDFAASRDDASSASSSPSYALDNGSDLVEEHGGLIGQRSSAQVDLLADYTLITSAASLPRDGMAPSHGYRTIGVPPTELLLLEAPERFPLRVRFAIYVLAATSAWALLGLLIAAVV